jgi:hypothetical protein
MALPFDVLQDLAPNAADRDGPRQRAGELDDVELARHELPELLARPEVAVIRFLPRAALARQKNGSCGTERTT